MSLCRTTLLRWILCSIWQLAGVPLTMFAAMLTPAAPAAAQGKLEARYDVTLAGIPVGTGAWTVDILDDQYSAAASGGATGLLKALAHGTGTGSSQGRIVNGALIPRELYCDHLVLQEIRDHSHVAGGRQCKGFRHRAEPTGRPQAHSGQRRA